VTDPFVAEIRMMGFDFPPTGWALCNGQLLPISQNTALFSLLGTTYGGDGKATFALPDLQDRAPMHQGLGPGMTGPNPSQPGTPYDLGVAGGADSVTLSLQETPVHNHAMRAHTTDIADTNVPNPNASFAKSSGGTLYQTGQPNTQLSVQALGIQGSSLPHNNLMPYLVVNFCIALQGVFPPRS
jgi:microcystin-dependent protein